MSVLTIRHAVMQPAITLTKIRTALHKGIDARMMPFDFGQMADEAIENPVGTP